MKKRILSLLLSFSIFGSTAQALNLHFKEQKNYVQINKTSYNNTDYVQVAACETIDTHDSAICKEITLIRSDEWARVKNCAGNMFVANYLAAGITFPISITVGSFFSTIAAVAGLSVPGYFFYKSVYAGNQIDVFSSDEIANAEHIKNTMRYEWYVDTLQKSMKKSLFSCSVNEYAVGIASDKIEEAPLFLFP